MAFINGDGLLYRYALSMFPYVVVSNASSSSVSISRMCWQYLLVTGTLTHNNRLNILLMNLPIEPTIVKLEAVIYYDAKEFDAGFR